MPMVVRIAACCMSDDAPYLKQGILKFSEDHGTHIKSEFYYESSEFLEALQQESLWDFLIVAVHGARGMETVVSARELAPDTPLLWCSDDAEFAVASYRLRCDMFMPLPLKPGDMEMALHCHLMKNS